ncbi:glycosyltransferase [Effusibacillus consociatus]|uniref:Glycosyltransferase n=1 Tax=Effusibacillus consociatus TaxID=1117041 RepID=A0ABV9QBB2_9BACL
MEPKVSVIIPTYNQVDFVHETINSVLNQTYSNIEIIITDDGSTDGTQKVLQKYGSQHPDKIKLVMSDKNTGIASNFNRGLNVVSGDFIAWLGGDDLMFSEKIEKQVELLKSRPDAVGCCHDAEVFESDSGKILGLFSELYNGKRGLREGGIELLFDASYLMLPSTMMIRSAAVPTHGFDDRLKYTNDWLFDIEVFRQGKCVVINEVLGKYRRHDNNITSSPLSKHNGFEEGMLVLGVVEARYPELHRYVKKRRTVFFLGEAAKSYGRGEFSRCKGYIKKAILDGAIIRGLCIYFGLSLFGKFILQQIPKQAYNRPRWFVKIYKFILGGS